MSTKAMKENREKERNREGNGREGWMDGWRKVGDEEIRGHWRVF